MDQLILQIYTKNTQNTKEQKRRFSVIEYDETDIILRTQGQIGLWQIIIVIIMTLFNIPAVFQVASPEVTSGQDHISTCARPTHLLNITLTEWREISGIWTLDMKGDKVWDQCSKKDLPENASYFELIELINNSTIYKTDCTTWEYDGSKRSIKSQFNLACSFMPINNLAESVFSLGAFLGDIINGFLSDRYGRRRVLMLAQGFLVLSGFFVANVPSFKMYLICRFIQGYLCSAIMLCSFVICIEILGGKWRSILTNVYTYSYSLGYISLSLFSYLFSVWIHLQYSISLMAIFLLSIWWLVPESPRWLLTVQKMSKLMNVLETASSFNSIPLLSGISRQIKNTRAMRNKNLKKANFPMLFKTKMIRWISSICPFAIFFCSITYYGLVLNNSLFSTNLLLSAFTEFSAVTFVLLLGVEDEVWLVTVSIALSGMFCLIGSCIIGLQDSAQKAHLLDMVMAFARFFGAVMNTTLFSIICCMYPTIMRTMGLGFCHSFCNIAVSVAANVVLLSKVFMPLPLIIMGMSAIIGSISMFFIPPKISGDLMDLIEEVECRFRNKSHSPSVDKVEPIMDAVVADEEQEIEPVLTKKVEGTHRHLRVSDMKRHSIESRSRRDSKGLSKKDNPKISSILMERRRSKSTDQEPIRLPRGRTQSIDDENIDDIPYHCVLF